jgi:hypothetical protein
MTERTRTTSLWKLIEALQRRLEAEGLDREVVDLAVTRGLEAWLDPRPEGLPDDDRAGAALPWWRGLAVGRA